MRNDSNAISTYRKVYELISKSFPAKTTPLCDLGAGEFEFLLLMKEKGYSNLTGTTYQPKKVSAIRSISDIDLSVEYANKIGSKYKVVTALDVIEHLVNAYSLMRDARELLDEGGKLILSFPNIHSLRSRIAFFINGRFTGFFGPNFNDGHPLHDQHIWIPNKHLLNYFCKVLDLEISEIRYAGGLCEHEWFASTTILAIQYNAN